MKYQEIKIGETYLYNNKEYKVLYKHDETQSIFVLNLMSNTTSHWTQVELKNFKPKVKPLPETGLLRGSKGSLIYRTCKTNGYGFDSYGKFGTSFFCIFDNDWKEATKEDYSEFRYLVIQHLKGLGFKDGDSFISLISERACTINFDEVIKFSYDGFTLGGHFMYFNNEWIQPISAKETEKEKLKTLLNQVKDILDSM